MCGGEGEGGGPCVLSCWGGRGGPCVLSFCYWYCCRPNITCVADWAFKIKCLDLSDTVDEMLNGKSNSDVDVLYSGCMLR